MNRRINVRAAADTEEGRASMTKRFGGQFSTDGRRLADADSPVVSLRKKTMQRDEVQKCQLWCRGSWKQQKCKLNLCYLGNSLPTSFPTAWRTQDFDVDTQICGLLNWWKGLHPGLLHASVYSRGIRLRRAFVECKPGWRHQVRMKAISKAGLPSRVRLLGGYFFRSCLCHRLV